MTEGVIKTLEKTIEIQAKHIELLEKQLVQSHNAYSKLLIEFSTLEGQEEYIDDHKDEIDPDAFNPKSKVFWWITAGMVTFIVGISFLFAYLSTAL